MFLHILIPWVIGIIVNIILFISSIITRHIFRDNRVMYNLSTVLIWTFGICLFLMSFIVGYGLFSYYLHNS